MSGHNSIMNPDYFWIFLAFSKEALHLQAFSETEDMTSRLEHI